MINSMQRLYYTQRIKSWGIVSLLLIIIGGLLLSGCNALAAPKVYRVGVLNGAVIFSGVVDGFQAKMTELGYVEGENITYDIHQSTGDPAEDQQILEQFVADEVDLILVFPTGSTVAAKSATQSTDIPVLFAVTTVEGADLVESVRKPGGNITGVRQPGPEITVKRFELLHQMVPQAKRVLAVQLIGYPPSDKGVQALQPAAAAAGVELVIVPISTVDEIEPGLAALVQDGKVEVDAISILPDPVTQSSEGWEVITAFAAKHNLPIGGNASAQVNKGAIFSYSPDHFDTGQLDASLADKIFKGAVVGNLPVVTAEPRLRINYKLAQELGLSLPTGLLRQADEVIR